MIDFNSLLSSFNQGTGFDAPVRAIARLDSNNTYFVGGQFSCYDVVGGICLTMTTWGIVAYDPVTYRYTPLADNFVATSVTLDAIAIDQIGGVIYVAGYAIFSNDLSRANQSTSVLAYDGIKWFQVGEFNSPTEKLYARTYASLYFVQSTGTLYGLFDELASPVQLDEWGHPMSGLMVFDGYAFDWISMANGDFHGIFPSLYVHPGYFAIVGDFYNMSSNFVNSTYYPINSLLGPLGGLAFFGADFDGGCEPGPCYSIEAEACFQLLPGGIVSMNNESYSALYPVSKVAFLPHQITQFRDIR